MLPSRVLPASPRATPAATNAQFASSSGAIANGKSQLILFPSLDRVWARWLARCGFTVRPASQRAGLPNAMRCDNSCGGGPDASVGVRRFSVAASGPASRAHASAICPGLAGPGGRGVLKRAVDCWIWSQQWSTYGVASSTSTQPLHLQKMAIKHGVRTRVRRSAAVITVTATQHNRRTPPMNVANPYAREEIEAHLEKMTLPRLSQSGRQASPFP